MKHNPQDKEWWCRTGEEMEESFVALYNLFVGAGAGINPEKETNKYAPDIIINGQLADLKVQNTPFYTSDRYGLSPSETVTFNRKDYERYTKHYPDIHIYFWVNWPDSTEFGEFVPKFNAIFHATLDRLSYLIELAPEHHYQNRTDDTNGNGKSSFLININDLDCIWVESDF